MYNVVPEITFTSNLSEVLTDLIKTVSSSMQIKYFDGVVRQPH